VLTSDKPIKPEKAARIKTTWEELHQGLTRAHRIAVLEDGLKFNPISVNPVDAQLLESRKFQVEEQCRWFRMPPHMIQHLERSTNNNIEHQSREFLMFTMLPWLVNWQQAMTEALLTEQEQKEGFYIAFVMGALLKGDMKSQMDAMALGRQWGIWSANDCREMLEENAIDEGGDIYLVPMNMISAEQAADWKAEPASARAAKAPAALSERYRLRMSPLFAQASARFVRIETLCAKRMLDKMTAGSATAADLERELEKVWSDLPERVATELRPCFQVLTDMCLSDGTRENLPGDGSALGAEAMADIALLLDRAGVFHVRESRDSVADALACSEPLDALRALLASWEGDRAALVATRESSNVVKLAALRAA
jgi:hypothetical protein